MNIRPTPNAYETYLFSTCRCSRAESIEIFKLCKALEVSFKICALENHAATKNAKHSMLIQMYKHHRL